MLTLTPSCSEVANESISAAETPSPASASVGNSSEKRPYVFPIRSFAPWVSGATRETFMDYIGHWYKPPRMVVGVSGMVGNDLIPTLVAIPCPSGPVVVSIPEVKWYSG